MKKNIGILLFLLFVLICTGIIVFALIKKGSYPDSGLLKSCDTPTKYINYSGDKCTDICWGYKAPLSVAGDLAEIPAAIEAWNKAVGFTLFRATNATADIYVTDVLDTTRSMLAKGELTSHLADSQGCAFLAEIRIIRVYEPEQRALLIRHGLGHAIGLADDINDADSLMAIPVGTALRPADLQYAKTWKPAR